MSPLAPRPADFSKRKAVHLHRPDLGCSDVQEKGEKEEQEQNPNHLVRRQVRLPQPHVQLAYQAGQPDVPLWLLSKPALSEAEVQRFEQLYHADPMRYRDGCGF